MALFLTEPEVQQLLSMQDALTALDDAFRQQGDGTGTNRARQRVRQGNVVLHVLPGGLEGSVGLKFYATGRGNTRFWTVLFDSNSGELLTFMQADILGRIRTGAASGIATRYLSRPDASVLGIFGTGKQSLTQAAAVCAVRPIRQIKVWSRSAERAAACAQQLGDQLGVDARPESDARRVVQGSDVITTITTAKEPLFTGAWLEPGVHINAAGVNRGDIRELDDATVQRATLVAVDHLEQARLESGDLIHAAAAGAFAWSQAVELAQVVAGHHPGRQGATDITLFESQGIALWDLAVARRVYELARQRGVGRELDI